MKIKVSDYIAEFLVKKGITHVFTVPGGMAMHLNDSLGQHKDLEKIYNNHEQAASIGAEGFYRVSHKIAAVCVTSGPGGTNALTGVFGAWVDSIPMFVLSGQVKYETTVCSTGLPLRQLGDAEFDIISCAKTMTKYSEMITDPLTINYHLERAYELATTGRFGPVWLDIPLNIQAATIETNDLKPALSERIIKRDISTQIKKTVEILKTAKRPVLMFGSGIWLGKAKVAAIKLAEKLNVPVVTAWNSHDLISNDHPLYVGRPGTIGDRAGNFAVQNADVLVVLGSRLNIRQISYNWENFAKNAYKIIVDIDEFELKKPTIKPDLAVCCNVSDFIDDLLESKLENITPQKWLDYLEALREKYNIVRSNKINGDAKVNPYYFSDRVTSLSADNDIFVCANGSACVCMFQSAFIKKNTRLFANSGSASMGYEPAAIGAYYANNKKRVMCIAGDGSIMMNLQELQTIASHNMDIVIYVLNNDGYVSIKQTQDNFFGRRNGADPKSGLSMPNFKKLAKGFGIQYLKITSNKEVDRAIKKIHTVSGPIICEVFLDEKQGFEPKLSARKLPDGTMLSPSLEDMFPFIDRTEYEQNMSILKDV